MISYVKNWEIDINERLHGEELTLREYMFEKPFEPDTVYNIRCDLSREDRETLSKVRVLVPKKIQLIQNENIFEAIIFFGYGFTARVSKINGITWYEVTEMAKSIYDEQMIENSVGFFDLTVLWPNLKAA